MSDFTTKVSLTIKLEGSTLSRESKVTKIPFKVTEKDMNPSKKWGKNQSNKVVEEGFQLHKNLVVSKEASQNIRVTKFSYNYMISADNCPDWEKPKEWNKMSKKERLESHFQRTCDTVGGKSFTYEVFED